MRKALLAAVALWLIFTVLFVFTYPLNIAGDAINYLAMIVHLKSNLIHASGYPFVIGHLLHARGPLPQLSETSFWDPAAGVNATETTLLLTILFLQCAIHVVLAGLCIAILFRIFGPIVALVAIIVWGMSAFFMSSVSTAFPEWLQADLLFLTICLCALAYFQESRWKKVPAYVTAGGTFGLTFLVKYNSLIFGVVFLALMLLETIPWRLRWLTAFGCAAAFALVTGFHFSFFHYPSTRASAFHYDSGWVFMIRLATSFGNDALERPSGINTLKYRALSRVIPQDYKFARAFQDINDTASPEIKAHYRPIYDRIMAMPETELQEFISRHPRPPVFHLSLSVVPLYQYIGLPEGDNLATKVFLEFVWHNPSLFASGVLRGVSGSSIAAIAQPFVPLGSDLDGLRPVRALASGYNEYAPDQDKSPLSLRYWSPRLILWEPGLRLFEATHFLRPHPYLEFTAYLILLAGLVFRRSDQEKKIAATIMLALICFIISSNAIYPFRSKEAIAIWPMVCLLWAIAVKWAVDLVSATIARIVAKFSFAMASATTACRRLAPPSLWHESLRSRISGSLGRLSA
jgi:hypothetical protein